MAKIKYIATTSDKIEAGLVPFQTGQIIFSRDDRVIYLDSTERISFRQIMFLEHESERKNLISPVNRGFYFVEDTAVLWNYTDGIWYPLNQTPEERVVFDNLPATGKANILYIEGTELYRWDTTSREYYKIGDPSWGAIS